ncbi:MAG: hypothetical protein Pg6A_04040 [Termitinemataceae bacterium]|nr:MAG: hypothetical protein Pg6A_04040 [Termitinemataceae bacterium]
MGENLAVVADKKITIFHRMFLWKGVIRRFFIYVFKGHIKNHGKRKGKCLRCGSCCKLMFKVCPYLKTEADGKCTCVKHESFRMPNCEIFPVDIRDIKDRNILSKQTCGYYFE